MAAKNKKTRDDGQLAEGAMTHQERLEAIVRGDFDDSVIASSDEEATIEAPPAPIHHRGAERNESPATSPVRSAAADKARRAEESRYEGVARSIAFLWTHGIAAQDWVLSGERGGGEERKKKRKRTETVTTVEVDISGDSVEEEHLPSQSRS